MCEPVSLTAITTAIVSAASTAGTAAAAAGTAVASGFGTAATAVGLTSAELATLSLAAISGTAGAVQNAQATEAQNAATDVADANAETDRAAAQGQANAQLNAAEDKASSQLLETQVGELQARGRIQASALASQQQERLLAEVDRTTGRDQLEARRGLRQASDTFASGAAKRSVVRKGQKASVGAGLGGDLAATAINSTRSYLKIANK